MRSRLRNLHSIWIKSECQYVLSARVLSDEQIRWIVLADVTDGKVKSAIHNSAQKSSRVGTHRDVLRERMLANYAPAMLEFCLCTRGLIQSLRDVMCDCGKIRKTFVAELISVMSQSSYALSVRVLVRNMIQE